MRNGLATVSVVMLAGTLLGCGGASDKDKARHAYQTIATCQQGHMQPQITAAIDTLRGLMAAHPHDSAILGYGQQAVDEMRRCTGLG